jgi:predicted alpha/beta superfamily hydrolase
MTPRVFTTGIGIFLCVSAAFAGPAEAPLLFTNSVTTSGNTNVFVVGSIPQLGNWDPTRAVKLSTNGNVWGANVWGANIGIREGTSYEYKFIRRAGCATCYSNGANATWEPDPNRAGASPAGPPEPYNGKSVFYYSSWSSVSILYSNTTAGWTFKPMTAIGPGRGGSEQIWRVDGLNKAGDPSMLFVFTDNLGNWDNPDGVPNRNYDTPLDACAVQDGQVYNYWPPATVSTNRVVLVSANASFNPTNGLANRSLRIYLPRGYTQNTTKRYPVLYMHDGQNIFIAQYAGCCGCWYADTNANDLIRFGKMRETIIVGVDNSSDRFCEYDPAGCTYSQCSTSHGSQYASWIVDKVRPYINANYRTLTDAENTGVLGSSLGGLISAYIGWQYSNTFGKIGCISSSFWVCDPISAPATKRPIRIYLDSGNKDTSSSTGDSATDSLLDTVRERDKLIQNGYVFNMDLDHTIGYGHWHAEQWWNVRTPRCFTFLYPSSDEPNTVLDAVAPMQIINFQAAGDSNIVTWTSYRMRTYTVQGSTNESFSSSMNWSNVFTTAPEPRFWDYPSMGVSNDFHFLRIRQNTVPNWPN